MIPLKLILLKNYHFQPGLYFPKSYTLLSLTIFVTVWYLSASPLQAQTRIDLPAQSIPGVEYSRMEIQYTSQLWNTEVITNVSEPHMLVYEPSEATRNGAAVIVAPGGGLFAHSINSEGIDVATWLTKKGFTAFVLKYRLVPTGEEGVGEMSLLGQQNPQQFMERISKVLPYSIQDGLEAVRFVREQADLYQIDPSRIGLMGFSAGGAVTMGVAYQSDEATRPDFLVPVYAWTDAVPVQEAPNTETPMLVICATDDPLGLASGSLALYESWLEKGYNVGLHMYAKGGHGFGMRVQGLPSDQWIERFYEWAVAEGIDVKKSPPY